jgi:hypothetical protein
MGKKDEKKADVELNAIAEGIAAIGRGDYDGGADALRFAQDIQQRRDEREARGKKKD